jgi:hypothetical protein
MLKLLFLTIILYIIIQHLLDDCEENRTPSQETQIVEDKKEQSIKPLNYTLEKTYSDTGSFVINANSAQDKSGMVMNNTKPSILKSANKPKIELKNTNENFAVESKVAVNSQPAEPKIWEFDKPNPWTRIILNEQDEYPYYFHIKINIPSLKDYQVWKQIVPNLDFNPKTGEIIIPSKEEASALALANLICINFAGQMSIENILEKNLIQISVAKSRSYELVQNKLREQIMENLYGKSVTKVQTSFEQDLAVNSLNNNNNSRVDFTSEQFSDTFEHFSDQNNKSSNAIDAYDGSDFSYL